MTIHNSIAGITMYNAVYWEVVVENFLLSLWIFGNHKNTFYEILW